MYSTKKSIPVGVDFMYDVKRVKRVCRRQNKKRNGESKMAKTNGVINSNRTLGKINKEIYGHFSEHLGRCIYEGIFVGKDYFAGRADVLPMSTTGWTESDQKRRENV